MAAIATQPVVVWQHNANPNYKLASIPRYDDSANGRLGGCAILKIARRMWEVGVAGSPVIGRRRGAFSTLLRQSGLRASIGGVLAQKANAKR